MDPKNYIKTEHLKLYQHLHTDNIVHWMEVEDKPLGCAIKGVLE